MKKIIAFSLSLICIVITSRVAAQSAKGMVINNRSDHHIPPPNPSYSQRPEKAIKKNNSSKSKEIERINPNEMRTLPPAIASPTPTPPIPASSLAVEWPAVPAAPVVKK